MCLLMDFNLSCISKSHLRHLHVDISITCIDKSSFGDPDLCATPEISNYKGGSKVGIPWVPVLSCTISSDYASC